MLQWLTVSGDDWQSESEKHCTRGQVLRERRLKYGIRRRTMCRPNCLKEVNRVNYLKTVKNNNTVFKPQSLGLWAVFGKSEEMLVIKSVESCDNESVPSVCRSSS